MRCNVPTADWRAWDGLFITENEAQISDTILRNLGNAPVLTVGDLPGFVISGGMIGLRT